MNEPQLKRQHAIDALDSVVHILLEDGTEHSQNTCFDAIQMIYQDRYAEAIVKIGQVDTYSFQADELLSTARLCLESLINMQGAA